MVNIVAVAVVVFIIAHMMHITMPRWMDRKDRPKMPNGCRKEEKSRWHVHKHTHTTITDGMPIHIGMADSAWMHTGTANSMSMHIGNVVGMFIRIRIA